MAELFNMQGKSYEDPWRRP